MSNDNGIDAGYPIAKLRYETLVEKSREAVLFRYNVAKMRQGCQGICLSIFLPKSCSFRTSRVKRDALSSF
jgi:hypothetical protein